MTENIKTITHAAHCPFTGRALHDIEQITVPYAERNDHWPFKFHVGFVRPDGTHDAVCERTVPPSSERCPKCKDQITQ